MIGPAAWAINTQLGEMLPHLECQLRIPILASTSWALAAVSLAAAYVSWPEADEVRHQPAAERADISGFVETLSTLTATIFAFALVLQGAAAVVLTGCER